MKSEATFQRYFLAIIPPEPIFSEVHQLKEYLRENYNTKAALNSPPHITLHMPFRWKEHKEAILIKKLEAFGQLHSPFEINLNNFKAFAPRVIYANVVANNQLTVLQKELERFCKISFQLFNANRLDQPFHPHLTLAFRDLKKETFNQAWNEFRDKKYDAKWQVESLYILKHNGTLWEMFTKVALEKTIH
jgi:2'-5' RNA ligase